MTLLRAAFAMSIALLIAGIVRADDADAAVATVNGSAITAGDLEFAFLSRRIPEEQRAAARERVLSQCIDRRLMAGFLASRNVKPADVDVQAEVDRIHDLIRRAGDDPAKVLPKLGYTDERLRGEVSLPLAWAAHARRAVTDTQIREFWQSHREEYDGTQVRASQIFIKLATDRESPELAAAETKLASLRDEIRSGAVTFAAAAEKHSQSPSAAKGGDVGYFAWRGKMPAQFSQAAFPLKAGEVSDPFRTPFGVHLITATDRKPGDLSLEDARPRIAERLQQNLWDETVRDLRAKAKIEMATPAP